MLGALPACPREVRQPRMFVEIVDVAMQGAPQLIDYGDGSQAVTPEVEEVVLAGNEVAFQVGCPHFGDAPFHAVAGRGS